MNDTTRRLDRIDDALWERAELPPDLEALCQRIAAEEGIGPAELRADAITIARQCSGLSVDAMIERIAAIEGVSPDELRCDMDAVSARAGL